MPFRCCDRWISQAACDRRGTAERWRLGERMASLLAHVAESAIVPRVRVNITFGESGTAAKYPEKSGLRAHDTVRQALAVMAFKFGTALSA
jgi:hypothetical protein